jgi:hypothetical protein
MQKAGQDFSEAARGCVARTARRIVRASSCRRRQGRSGQDSSHQAALNQSGLRYPDRSARFGWMSHPLRYQSPGRSSAGARLSACHGLAADAAGIVLFHRRRGSRHQQRCHTENPHCLCHGIFCHQIAPTPDTQRACDATVKSRQFVPSRPPRLPEAAPGTLKRSGSPEGAGERPQGT